MSKVSNLNKSVNVQAYQQSLLHRKYKVWRGGDVKNVEKEW